MLGIGSGGNLNNRQPSNYPVWGKGGMYHAYGWQIMFKPWTVFRRRVMSGAYETDFKHLNENLSAKWRIKQSDIDVYFNSYIFKVDFFMNKVIF